MGFSASAGSGRSWSINTSSRAGGPEDWKGVNTYGVFVMRRLFLRFLSLTLALMVSIAAHAQTPRLVYSKSLSTTSETGNGFKIQYGGSMGTGTLASNLLTLRMTYPHGSTVSSISDNKSSTYTLGASVDSGAWVTALYYVP